MAVNAIIKTDKVVSDLYDADIKLKKQGGLNIMKKIIEGKMYNTETATYIGSYRTDTMGKRDFHYLEEDLYQKRTKEFFLCGEGGAMTKYAKYVEGCGYTYGEKIIPLSENEAKDWMEGHMDVSDYVELFGECEE